MLKPFVITVLLFFYNKTNAQSEKINTLINKIDSAITVIDSLNTNPVTELNGFSFLTGSYIGKVWVENNQSKSGKIILGHDFKKDTLYFMDTLLLKLCTYKTACYKIKDKFYSLNKTVIEDPVILSEFKEYDKIWKTLVLILPID